MERINDNNYELWMLRYAEGELTAAEREVVESWLESHPEAAEELALYNEAPRLERDESIRYKAPVRPLWPLMVRWSAAAVVVVALMLPAFRMETMSSLEVSSINSSAPAPLLSQNTTLQNHKTSKAPKAPKVFNDLKDSKDSNDLKDPIDLEDTKALKEELLAPEQPIIIEVNSLIAFESDDVSGDTLYTTALIIYERSSDWGDALLAANDSFHDGLSSRPLGRMVSRALPDSRRLKEKVVEPLREKIDNVKNIIK